MNCRSAPQENLAAAVVAMMEVSPLAEAIAGMSDERWEAGAYTRPLFGST